nr:hypothetical protein [Tanacetum cinerariifolium]
VDFTIFSGVFVSLGNEGFLVIHVPRLQVGMRKDRKTVCDENDL